MAAEDKLKKFVRRVCAAGSGYTSITLIQVSNAGGGSSLRVMPLDSQFGYDDSKISEMVAELVTTAQEDADGHRGLTAYCLKAQKGVMQGERSPLFRLRAQESEYGDDEPLGETEPNTPGGLLGQLMRHNEANTRILAQVFEVQSRSHSEEKRRLLDQLQHYEDRHWDVVMRAEDLANEKDTRETARLQLTAQEKRKDQIIALLKPLVPIAMAKFKGTPADAKPGLWQESLKAILADLSPEKMEQIANIMGPHSLALAEMYMDAHKEADKADDEQAGSAGSH